MTYEELQKTLDYKLERGAIEYYEKHKHGMKAFVDGSDFAVETIKSIIKECVENGTVHVEGSYSDGFRDCAESILKKLE